MIRVRFAPSPTGDLHLGGLRTALYNYVFAKKHNGSVVLRIEDTDQSRLVQGSTNRLIECFQKLKINFDEGPTQGGKYWPYVQSQRLKYYREYSEQLMQRGAAYHCFCSKERLEALKAEGKLYDGHCRELPYHTREEYLRQGIPHVIRMKVPDSRNSTFVDDSVFGRVEFAHSTVNVSDQVLMKGDGFPTYHLANVVDDHLMEITHVLRGEEWLTSTAKHVILYESFGWDPPVYCHLPILLSSEGKLSKRDRSSSVQAYLSDGYQPAAILNYVAMLGWAPKDSSKEVLSLADLIEEFSLEDINKSQPRVDTGKLKWLNRHHLLLALEEDHHQHQILKEFKQLVIGCYGDQMVEEDVKEMTKDEYLLSVIRIMTERTSLLPEMVKESEYFFVDPPQVSHDRDHILMKDMLLSEICCLGNSTTNNDVTAVMETVANKCQCKYSDVAKLMRWALTGNKKGPGVAQVTSVLPTFVVKRRLS